MFNKRLHSKSMGRLFFLLFYSGYALVYLFLGTTIAGSYLLFSVCSLCSIYWWSYCRCWVNVEILLWEETIRSLQSAAQQLHCLVQDLLQLRDSTWEDFQLLDYNNYRLLKKKKQTFNSKMVICVTLWTDGVCSGLRKHFIKLPQAWMFS